MDKLAQDLAYENAPATPVFTIVVVMSLGLGIGANTAVFTIINAVMLRELPVPHPGELMRLSATPVLSFGMFQDLRARQQVFTDILATTREAGASDDPRSNTTTLDNVPTAFVSSNYFDVLMLRPRAGRSRPGRPTSSERGDGGLRRSHQRWTLGTPVRARSGDRPWSWSTAANAA